MTLYIGIDPGLSGALAWLVDSGFEHAGVVDAVTAERMVGRTKRRDYMPAAMASQLAELCATWAPHEPRAAMERVHSLPGQGVASTFAFGRGAGIWEGILSALQIPYETVEPARWKKAVGLAVRADKGESRLMAARLFPQLTSSLLRAKDDGRAEALLIAEFRRRKEMGS